MKKREEQSPFKIGDVLIPPGIIKTVRLPVSMTPSHSVFDMMVRVIHGRHTGKRLFISSTIHGDEINGIEIIRRILGSPLIKHIKGTLVVIPVVNIFGMLNQARYLEDRRDLNRSFPGSDKGSAASQLAHTFLKEVVKKCTHGIDLHTASNNRINLPQIRCEFECKESLKLAKVFGAPVVLKAQHREGSLREAAEKLGISTLTFEGGEASRFNEFAIRAAVQGIIRVMCSLEMLPSKSCPAIKTPPVVSKSNHWVRAPSTGFFRSTCALGKKVLKGDVLGKISNTIGTASVDVVAHLEGVVIGKTQLPIVYRGDALFNIAWVPDPRKAEEVIEELEEEVHFNPALDDPMTY